MCPIRKTGDSLYWIDLPQVHTTVQRAPHPSLNGLVRQVWHSMPSPGLSACAASYERMMPTGEMHLVLRLSGSPLKIAEGGSGAVGRHMGYAVVNGARAAWYTKAGSPPGQAIGVQLRPGAAQALFGLPADELTGRHVLLDDLWGPGSDNLREQLQALPTVDARLDCLENRLLQCWQAGPQSQSHFPAHPAVLAGLQHLRAGRSVDEAARRSGYSHRQFARLFARDVGLAPKLYARVQRFQKALQLLHADGLQASFADVAFLAGYSDQPHFNRDFREFSGLMPEQYRAARPVSANHVPVFLAASGDVHFVQDRRRLGA